MSAKETSTLLTLPTELIEKILHHLDVRDIAFSFRYVCSAFYQITNGYNRYKVCIESTSLEPDVRRLCQVIRPENIISLKLRRITNEPDRISLFLSLIKLNELTRLTSLELYGVNQSDLRPLTPHIDHHGTLKHLSIVRMLGEWEEDTAVDADHVMTLMAGRALQQLSLYRVDTFIAQRLASRQYHFHTLEIHQAEDATIMPLFPHLPNVRVFSCRYYCMGSENPVRFPPGMLPFNSLTLKIPNLMMDRLEPLLMRTPSLVQLRLSGCCELTFLEHVASRWERFIRRYLKSLRHFQFFFTCSTVNYDIVPHLERILNQFRARFWIEEMNCSVTCKYINNETRSDLLVYSPADPSTNFPDNLCTGILSYTTTTSESQDRDHPDCRWSARLSLSEIENAISTEQLRQPERQLFPTIERLALDIEWPMHTLTFLSTFVGFLHLREIWLFLSGYHSFDSDTLTSLLNEACYVHVFGLVYDDDTTLIPVDILQVLSQRVDHLKLRTIDVNPMIWVLEHINGLSTITFEHAPSALTMTWHDLVQWLTVREKRFSISSNYRSVQVWCN